MRVRTPRPKVCKLACKPQGVGVFAKAEIPVAVDGEVNIKNLSLVDYK